MCHTKTGTGAVIPKMKQLDLHAVPTIPVPEGHQGSSNTQLSSELISAVVLVFLAQKCSEATWGSGSHQLQAVLYFLTDRPQKQLELTILVP